MQRRRSLQNSLLSPVQMSLLLRSHLLGLLHGQLLLLYEDGSALPCEGITDLVTLRRDERPSFRLAFGGFQGPKLLRS